MKKIFALVAVLLATLSTCCASVAPPPRELEAAQPKPPDEVHVRVWLEADITLHVDTACPHPDAFEQAAERWRTLTHGNARIALAFDVDFSSLSNLREHKAKAHHRVVCLRSQNAQAIDARHPDPRFKVHAETAWLDDGSTVIHMITDRIRSANFAATATHEFGHVLGLPDLEESGAVMSGVALKDEPPHNEFTPADVALCRTARFCE